MLWVKLVYKYRYGCKGDVQNIRFETIPAYLTTTNDPSSTAFQVGAFSTDVRDLGNGTVQYTMYNKAGWHSLMGGLNPPSWDHDRQDAFPMHEMNRFGGDVRQMFQGTGPNPCQNSLRK